MNEEKGFNKTVINCKKLIYRKFLRTIENTYFLIRDYFVFHEKNKFNRK